MPVTTPPFPETVFGMLKRVRVFSEWLERARHSMRKERLRILDFGCGTGALVTIPLSAAGDEILGVDVHAPSIDQARASIAAPNVSFSTENADQLLARGATFDAIICSEVLEHLPDPGVLLGKLRDLLAPGGTLIVSVPNGRGVFEQMVRLENAMHSIGVEAVIDVVKWPGRAFRWKRAGRGWPPRPGNPRELTKYADEGYLNQESPHLQFFRRQEIMGLFRSSGFEVVEYRGRTLACGPYIGPLLNLTAAVTGGWIFRLNCWLGDHAPANVVSDWMFCLRKQ